MMVGYIILGIVVVLLIAAFWIYNSLIRAKVRANEAWSDITVQLKRRYDLIPNLVNTVQGYAAHEKQVFEDVTKARSQAMSAQTVGETAKAEGQFQQALKSLFAVAEAYPQLRASENFQQLQAELTDTEDKIQASRRFYNGAVRDLNIKIQSIPTNIVAGAMNLKPREFFELEGTDAEAVKEPVAVNFLKDSGDKKTSK